MKNVLLAASLLTVCPIFAQNPKTAKKPAAGKTKVVAAPASEKPNILVIMPDDVGYWNVGAYNNGMMVPTPSIDRIGQEGMLFTDHYAAPSCTAGRAMFITGQLPIRTGLTTVGMAGSPIGLSEKDPTLAELLKPLGYRTGQFGKNHLGDRNEHLPTVHGFDEFYGNLYHLNTEEEPSLEMWPKDSGFNKRYKPRGVLDCIATNVDDATVDPRFGKVGKQKIKDTGPLDPKRMETVDEEFLSRTMDFMERSTKEGKPFFAWFNPSRMHIYTHLKPESKNLATPYSSEFDIYGSGLMELDDMVRRLLKKLEDLGVANNTIVVFTTDNGAMADWFPDGGTTPFRGEKATTWEGGVRVPMLVRWPARIPAGKKSNGIQDHCDMFTTLAAAAGVNNVQENLKASHKVYIDGVNNLNHWTSNAPSARQFEIYYNESDLTAIRIGHWKSHIQTREGFFDYNKPSALLVNLRMDPFERHTDWKSREVAMRLGIAWGGQVQDIIGAHLKTLSDFPPRQKGGSLTVKPGDLK
ncbi:arylsulfatase [Flavihumibacter rivuli]|uniref:arylsulfatase n=1 Tax=Flavihumibacter rivuli TaxID=2838156 RepID=UPI001BDEC00D|nr:arylsulfatase [Flavihumibacter rivuli]ULQ55814.1 arylsulfatase [Flavihumibacter rivuli]